MSEVGDHEGRGLDTAWAIAANVMGSLEMRLKGVGSSFLGWIWIGP